MASFLFWAVLLLSNPSASAQSAECLRSYRSDSFGRGLEAAMRGGDLKPAFADDLCYLLGKKRGAELRADGAGCRADFDEGYGRGTRVGAVETGTPCYEAGYRAGLAALTSSAREGGGDRDCRGHYDRGYRAGSHRTGQAIPASGRAARVCYLSGYTDGEWFQIEQEQVRQEIRR